MFIGGVNLSGNSNSALPPPPSTSSGLSRTNSIPFGSILNSCSSWGIFYFSHPWPAFAKRNDWITKVHTAVTGTLIADCGRSTLLFVRRYIQWPKSYQIKCNFFIASPDLFNQSWVLLVQFLFCKSVFLKYLESCFHKTQVLLVWFLRWKSEKVGQNPAAHEYIQHYGNQAALKVAE